MPTRPRHGCRAQGCPELISRGSFCSAHWQLAPADLERGNSAARGYGRRWRKLREYIIARDPFCRSCSARWYVDETGPLVISTDVDHIIPRRAGGSDGDDNLQGLCKGCHSRKTASGA